MAMMASMRTCIPAGSYVLDVGGAVVNGSYRTLFKDCKYTSLDFANADIIVKGYDWTMIANEQYDAVISGQTFEHDKFFWLTMKNIARVLKPGGHAIIIAPAAGAVHRHPIDCWRFYPDSMAALAEWSGLELLGKQLDAESPWKDLGGVFRKPEREIK